VKTILLESALSDLDEGYDFYEEQNVGLGDYFQNCLLADIAAINRHAGVHREIFGYHHVVSKRFPYIIYYRVSDAMILVFRVLDGRRDAKWIEDQLK